MTPQQVPVLRQSHPSTITQKVQLTYKLFLLENGRNKLEQELRNFTNQAYQEVQGFLTSSFPNSVFSDLTKALDVKCQAIAKLSALLKDLTVEPQVCIQPTVKNGGRTNQLKSHGAKEILMTNVLKFGPMMQSSLMSCSIAKAVQVLGAALFPQQLKVFRTSQPAAVQQDDLICNTSASYSSATLRTSSSCDLTAEEQQINFEKKEHPECVDVPPANTESCEINVEKPQILLPPIPAVLPEMCDPKSTNIPPLIRWGREEDVQVQHQKQTSSQLLHFLRAKAKNMGALEVTLMEWTNSIYTVDLPLPVSPTIKAQSYHFEHVNEDLTDGLAPKMLHTNTENQVPVFRLKRKSSGSLIYSCVIATETELWDIGEIFTEVVQVDSVPSVFEGEENIISQVENSCVNINWKTQTPQCTVPEHENSSTDAKTPTFNSVKIPEFQIRKFEEAEVVVSHIVSPSNFYIHNTDSSEKLQALVTDWKASSSYAEQNCIPDIGTQVMGWFPNHEQWCRAQVMKICGVSRDNTAANTTETSIKVEVKRLDYGDADCVSLWNIKEMTPEMAVLPLQAVQVSLANVTPANGMDWSEEAVGWFKAMVHSRTLYARVYPQGPKVAVELFLEKGKLGAMRRGASLSLRLAQNGHAEHSKLKNTGHMKKSAVQLKKQKQDSEWEKHLILSYSQNKK